MRGLTPAERAELTELCIDGPPTPITGDEEEVLLDSLVRYGRAVKLNDAVYGHRWDPTPLGRLALRLWPATMATPGAGEGP